MAKKDFVQAEMDREIAAASVNPLLAALAENDKNHLFKANISTAFLKTGFPQFDYYFGSTMNIHDENGIITNQEPRAGQAAGTFNLIIGNTGSGKAQPLSTWIPSLAGSIQMKDIVEGDKIFGSDGSVIEVTGVYPQGMQSVYKMIFSDGRCAYCTDEHLWTIIDPNGRQVTLTLNDIIASMETTPDGKCPYRFPMLRQPIQYPSRNTEIDPYVAGALFGISMKLQQVESYQPEQEVVWNIRQSLDIKDDAFQGLLRAIQDPSIMIDTWPNVPLLVLTRNIREQYISTDYLLNGPTERMCFLQGIMDTCGSVIYKVKEGRFEIRLPINHALLCEQLMTLLRSLGILTIKGYELFPVDKDDGYAAILILRPTVSQVYSMFRNGKNVRIVTSVIGASDIDESSEYLTLRDVYYHHDEECQCIKVSAEDELYVTEDFILTHNTTLASQIAANIIMRYGGNVIHFDCENRFDMSRCEIITKLPSRYFRSTDGLPEQYMIRGGRVGLDVIQEMIAKIYFEKMRQKDKLLFNADYYDEFKQPIRVFQPTVIIIDSLATVLSETFNPESTKDASDAEKMRSNTDGARDAKTLRGFLKDILPLCKEANIIIYGINHINQNMGMNSFLPVAKQQNFLKQDESIPGGRSLIYSAQNIIKLVARTSDSFSEDTDGFNGYVVMIEPVKSSSNQSGNNSKGISFELVFSQKTGFDSLRSLILYGRDEGLILGNKPKMKFKDDDSFTFNWKNLYTEVQNHPIYENVFKYVVPTLEKHLSFIDPSERTFDPRSLMY